ncbi:alpha/beta fold hydrolase [Thermosulfuriphilus sp.]
MKLVFLTRKAQPELLLFFSGWALDEGPFLSLAEGPYDIAMIYDYRSLKLPPLPSYSRIHILAWSLGATVVLHLVESLRASSLTFVNGTGAFVHSAWGIPPRIFQRTLVALKSRGPKALDDFWANMFSGEQVGSTGVDLRRRLPELIAELERAALLKEAFPKLSQARILIGSRDRIIPPRSQEAYWQKMGLAYEVRDWGHFPFYRFSSLAALIEEA